MDVGTQTMPTLGEPLPHRSDRMQASSRSSGLDTRRRGSGAGEMRSNKERPAEHEEGADGSGRGAMNGARRYSVSQEDRPHIHRRRYSERFNSNSASSFRRKFSRGGMSGGLGSASNRGRNAIVLPTRFLLGGNITDPLNLNSLCDETVNRLLNAPTPVPSPSSAPTTSVKSDPPLEVFRPANINDPLNLSGGADVVLPSSRGRRRRRYKKYKKKKGDQQVSEDMTHRVAAAVETRKNSSEAHHLDAVAQAKRNADKIVSPAIPQISPRRKRRRTSSEGKLEAYGGGAGKRVAVGTGEVPKSVVASVDAEDQGGIREKPATVTADSVSVGAVRTCDAPMVRQAPGGGGGGNRSRSKRHSTVPEQTPKHFRGADEKFIYGNYNAYYGYRNVGSTPFADQRITALPEGLFAGRDVLDIGCNVGYVTLNIARDYGPRMIVGMDIDRKLIEAAKRNIRHYMSEDCVASLGRVRERIVGGRVDDKGSGGGRTESNTEGTDSSAETPASEQPDRITGGEATGIPLSTVEVSVVQESDTVFSDRLSNTNNRTCDNAENVDGKSPQASCALSSVIHSSSVETVHCCHDDIDSVDDIGSEPCTKKPRLRSPEHQSASTLLSLSVTGALQASSVTGALPGEHTESKQLLPLGDLREISATVSLESLSKLSDCRESVRTVDTSDQSSSNCAETRLESSDAQVELRLDSSSTKVNLDVAKDSRAMREGSSEPVSGLVGSTSDAIVKSKDQRKLSQADADVEEGVKDQGSSLRKEEEEHDSHQRFPVSMEILYGPIAAHSLGVERTAAPRGGACAPSTAPRGGACVQSTAPRGGAKSAQFPHNVMFQAGNYILATDDAVAKQRPEYDVIMALSVSKWIHLNGGDAGLKRTFRRMFAQLRPGGKLVLEAQCWKSYKKKKKLTESIFRVYQSIAFRPEDFEAYLLSDEVGFASCQLIGVPYNQSKGFQRPIRIFTKR